MNGPCQINTLRHTALQRTAWSLQGPADVAPGDKKAALWRQKTTEVRVALDFLNTSCVFTNSIFTNLACLSSKHRAVLSSLPWAGP